MKKPPCTTPEVRAQIALAIKAAGGQLELALALGVTQQAVSGWLNGARWMQMFTAVSSFLATAQAAAAAETAEQAGDTAQEAQEQADMQADEEPLVDEAFDEDEIVVTAPRPAEAATELSER